MADPFQQSLDKLIARFPALDRRQGTRRPNSVTAIDVDGLTLRVAQATARGARGVITDVVAGEIEFPADADRSDAAVLGRAIASALARLRVRPGAVVMGVPRAQVLLRTVTVPMIPNVRELASVIHLQIAKDLPFRMEEAVIDFKVLRQIAPPARPDAEADGSTAASGNKTGAGAPLPKLEVLVAAAKREVIEFYVQTAKEAGLKLVGLGWLSHANACCVEACGVVEGEQGVALVSLRPDEVGIDIIAQQSLLFSRGATFQGPPESPATGAGMEPAAFVEAVTIEVVRSIHSYGGMSPHAPITKVLVGGVTGQEPAVAEALSRRLNLPCSVLDPAVALDLPKAARAAAPGAISAIGLALGGVDAQGLAFDFLNPKRPAVQRNLRRIRVLSGLAAAAVLVAVLLGVRTWMVNNRNETYRALQVELAAEGKNTPTYRRMLQQAATVKTWNGEGRNWLEHYAHLSAVLPRSEEVYLSSLALGSGGTIRFAVQARNGQVLAKLDKQLRAAGYDVKPLAITPGADRNGYDFRSTVELIVPAKMKLELAKVRPPARPTDDASLENTKKVKKK